MDQTFPPTVVFRHRRENIKKCSLHGLENREDFTFYRYPMKEVPRLDNYLLLAIDGPPLNQEDQQSGLLLLDASWRHADKMRKYVDSHYTLEVRSIPSHIRTAYPRRQDDCAEPQRGLASVEAIYIAYQILGRETSGLLDHYYWKKEFLDSIS